VPVHLNLGSAAFEIYVLGAGYEMGPIVIWFEEALVPNFRV
jgi:hypothetical protein